MKRPLHIVVSVLACLLMVTAAAAGDEKDEKYVARGDTVTLAYSMVVEDVVVESSGQTGPLIFTVGKGEVIPGIEKSVLGMRRGETRSFTVTPEDAYGERTEMERVIPKSELPPDIVPEERMILVTKDEQGKKSYITIKEVRDRAVLLDFNHPLAGKNLYFEVEVLDIR